MSIYICRWPNGDFSAVSAPSMLEAILLLDDVGSASPDQLFAVKEFTVHFKVSE